MKIAESEVTEEEEFNNIFLFRARFFVQNINKSSIVHRRENEKFQHSEPGERIRIRE